MLLEEALRPYWHPVATSDQVGDKPFQARLLSEPIALYRVGSEVVALRDLCIHRGTALSLGWLDGNRLVCAYHGWEYAPDGACVRIPSLPSDRAIPAKARARKYRCEERYGMVWVCLEDEPRRAIPPFPEWGAPGFHPAMLGPFYWKASAPRMVENNFDQTHLPWVHEGILGTRDRAEVEGRAVRREGEVLIVEYQTEEPAPRQIKGHSASGKATTSYHYTYYVHMPLATYVTKDSSEGERTAFLVAPSPLSAKETLVFSPFCRNYALEEPDEGFQERGLFLLEQDRAMVESQRPEEVPVDLSKELHLSNELSAVEYRRWLAELGVEMDGQASLDEVQYLV